MAKIHVVIPVYNVERYLRDCVYSVLNQPYKEIDIVLVDDGSPDHSGQVCDEISAAEDRVFVVHQENKGLPGARNTGIEFFLQNGVSEDDYFAFLDSDDLWAREIITEELVGKIKKADMITFSMYYTNATATRFKRNMLKYIGEYSSPKDVSFWALPHMVCSLYRVGLVKNANLRFSPLATFGEDEPFKLYAMYYARSSVGVDIPLVCYRHNKKSITHTSGRKPITPFLAEISALQDELDRLGIEDAAYRKRMEFYCCWLLLEMSEEYYRNLHIGDAPYVAIEKHSFGSAFCSYASADPQSDRVCQRIYFMLNKPFAFRWKLRVKGSMEYCLRIAAKLPVLSAVYERIRYPLSQLL